jgi:hypothetical protein
MPPSSVLADPGPAGRGTILRRPRCWLSAARSAPDSSVDPRPVGAPGSRRRSHQSVCVRVEGPVLPGWRRLVLAVGILVIHPDGPAGFPARGRRVLGDPKRQAARRGSELCLSRARALAQSDHEGEPGPIPPQASRPAARSDVRCLTPAADWPATTDSPGARCDGRLGRIRSALRRRRPRLGRSRTLVRRRRMPRGG